MRNVSIAAASIGLLLTAAVSTNAQWLNQPDKRTPRTAGGKPNLSAPAPRAPNGKPDLSGVWHAAASEAGEIRRVLRDPNLVDPGLDLQRASKYVMNILADFKPGEEPMRPETAAMLRQRMQGLGKDNPSARCLPGGVPFSSLIAPFKMIQTPDEIVVLIEDNNPPRQIYTDGRKLPEDPDPTWMGYSVGQWQGDTLVVDTIGVTDRSWLDAFGHPRSESMHITERFLRVDFGDMEVEVTVDDSKMYTKPFTIKYPVHLMPDTDILESICAENERDRSHIDR